MNSYVFVGPTISVAEVRAVSDATILPPVQYGDVYRLTVDRQPQVIGIIDGYFDQVLAVWHKEILWAMSQGAHVFGAASMGALRATELAAFGMCGIGRVFAAYRDGILEDDDEVAVLHGPAELDYRPLTEALVNIRSTLAQAAKQGVIDTTTCDTMTRIAKSIHYKHRSYKTLLVRAERQGISDTERNRLNDWLPEGKIDQKRDDALAMLIGMQTAVDRGPKRVSYYFEHTSAWEQFKTRIDHLDNRNDPERNNSAKL